MRAKISVPNTSYARLKARRTLINYLIHEREIGEKEREREEERYG